MEWSSNDTHISGIFGPPPRGDHYVLGSQNCLFQRGGKHEGKSFCSYPLENKETSNESKWSLQYSALKRWWKHYWNKSQRQQVHGHPLQSWVEIFTSVSCWLTDPIINSFAYFTLKITKEKLALSEGDANGSTQLWNFAVFPRRLPLTLILTWQPPLQRKRWLLKKKKKKILMLFGVNWMKSPRRAWVFKMTIGFLHG